MDNFIIASQYVMALTGDTNTVLDWRVINDKNKGESARNMRGTLADMWQQLTAYNAAGWGIFCNINALDGNGYELANVAHIRAHVVDLDNQATSAADYSRAIASNPLPQFAVQSSAGKFHVYWKVQPYCSNEFYTLMQRKLLQLYNGDKSIIDATRVMRVPGFYHHKGDPVLVTYWQLDNFSLTHTAEQLQAALAHVNVIDHFSQRQPLGTPEMQAPSLEWLQFVLAKCVDPNDLDRGEWLSMTAAIKQAGWNHAPESVLLEIWQTWCARYALNDAPENLKLWNSIRDTEVGWTSIERRTTVQAYQQFGFKDAPPVLPDRPSPSMDASSVCNQTADRNNLPEILDATDCNTWFKDCYFVIKEEKIFTTGGRFLGSTAFNAVFGGKQFITSQHGKTTDEPWNAATRSKVAKIQIVDHVRFLPEKPLFHIEIDAIGRKGINSYIPANIKRREGDPSRFLELVKNILPVEADRKIFLDYLAHCIKFPGYKVPWAIMLQSVEGVGKTAFANLMKNALGDMYVYQPKAPELVKSGSTFNAWMRAKLMIIVDEIKIDERRELIEILKPMITEARVEIQSKGVDQDMEDNAANWLFFSNHKDAIPINKNGRRYAIFYSALQTTADVLAVGGDSKYFSSLFKWLDFEGGYEIVTNWFLNYPIERGDLPVRAPETSSFKEALRLSRSPMEVIVEESVADSITGFRGGYVSAICTLNRCKAAGLRNVTAKAVSTCLEGMGYHSIGRATRPYMQEDVAARSELFSMLTALQVEGYGRAQGYE